MSRADAYSYDIFSTRFGPLLPTRRVNSLDEIISKRLQQEFWQYRETVLQPGGNVASYLDLLGEYLGRYASPKAYINMLRENNSE